jgi:hypothetical protein
MGLFDIFKKKSRQQKPEELQLEELLQKALGEPAYRDDFYRLLLKGTKDE